MDEHVQQLLRCAADIVEAGTDLAGASGALSPKGHRLLEELELAAGRAALAQAARMGECANLELERDDLSERVRAAESCVELGWAELGYSQEGAVPPVNGFTEAVRVYNAHWRGGDRDA